MEVTNRITYDVDKSSKRIDEILNAGNGNYKDLNYVPSRDSLTYANGYYVNVSSVFIDIVDSSDMTDEHKRPTLAKMYRAFISECTAIMNGASNCKEINIHGDCVWGVFDTPLKKDIDEIFNLAAKLNSLIQILNYKMKRKGYSSISVGIGIDYGRALMVKAGYSGSGLNDVIWMGDVVNTACHLANNAGRYYYKPVFVSSIIYDNLNDDNKKLLDGPMFIDDYYCYQGNIIDLGMEEWYKKNCK